MATVNKTIDIENVGPIDRLSIPIPDSGVVVLKGKNGSGKSQAIAGVNGLLSASARRGLRPKDGEASGRIEGVGVTLRLGRSNTARGELEAEDVFGGLDPSVIVDPGIKDPVVADSRRLAMLVRISHASINADEWAELFDNQEQFEILVNVEDLEGDDPVEVASRLRRKLHAEALRIEKEAKSRELEADAILKTLADYDLDDLPSEQVLRDQLDEVGTLLVKTKTQRETALDIQSRSREARRQLEAMETIDIERLEAEAKEAFDRLTEIKQERIECENEIKRLQDQLVGLKSQEQIAEAQANFEDRELRDARDALAARQKLIDIADAASPELPSQADLDALARAKDEALENYQRGVELIRKANDRDEALNAKKRAIAQLTWADRVREIARSTDIALERALQRAGFDEVVVNDGRLCVQTDRGKEPISELSHGERWKLALDLLCRGVGKDGVAPVAQEAWEALDPENRRAVAQMAKDRGLVLITAEAADGELRAETFTLN